MVACGFFSIAQDAPLHLRYRRPVSRPGILGKSDLIVRHFPDARFRIASGSTTFRASSHAVSGRSTDCPSESV